MVLTKTDLGIGVSSLSRTDEKQQRTSTAEVWCCGWPQTLDEFERFVEVFQDRIFRFLYVRLKNRHDAEDVMQMVFMKAYSNRWKLRKVKTQVHSYLYRMALNTCIDFIRKQKRRKQVAINQQELELVLSNEEKPFNEELERINDLLNLIPKKQAEVIRMRIVDDLDFDEIAEVLGCFVSTVRTRYRYGIAKIRKHILREELSR
jgi:RNA polymerase sigma-70 factor (ECF subfamily)